MMRFEIQVGSHRLDILISVTGVGVGEETRTATGSEAPSRNFEGANTVLTPPDVEP